MSRAACLCRFRMRTCITFGRSGWMSVWGREFCRSGVTFQKTGGKSTLPLRQQPTSWFGTQNRKNRSAFAVAHYIRQSLVRSMRRISSLGPRDGPPTDLSNFPVAASLVQGAVINSHRCIRTGIKPPQRFEFCGSGFEPRTDAHWKTKGLATLVRAGRVEKWGKSFDIAVLPMIFRFSIPSVLVGSTQIGVQRHTLCKRKQGLNAAS